MEATKPRASAFLAVALAVGCRAQPAGPADAAGDLAAAVDLASQDLTNLDSAELPDASCPAGSSEICGNGCDDDRNLLTDDDDPACTPQVVATFQAGSSQLSRLILQPLGLRFLDGNPVTASAHGVYHGGFAPGVAFLVLDRTERTLVRLKLPGASGAGAREELVQSYTTRDVCIFNGELVVVDSQGKLHRMMADGKTNIGEIQIPSWLPYGGAMLLSACASDGRYLYVSEHSATGLPSKFRIFDTSYTPIGSPVEITELTNQGYDRCLDFAWTRRGFYGLWTNSGGDLNDALLSAELHAPFALDGAVGPPVDGGTLHGIGEFTP